MALKDLTEQGFQLEGAAVSLETAKKLAMQRGLELPKGAGKYVFFSCIKTGSPRVALSSVWNAGRLSHKACCGRLSSRVAAAAAAENYIPTKPAHPTQAVLLQAREGLARASAIAKGHTPSKLFNKDTPNSDGTQLTLRVTQLGIETLFRLPPEGVAWLKWIQAVDIDPLQAGQPPAPVMAGKALSDAIKTAHKELQTFAWALGKAAPSLSVSHIHEGSNPPVGMAPTIIPKFTFESLALVRPYDWTPEDGPALLSPAQVAILAVLMLEYSSSAPRRPSRADSETLRHVIVEEFKMVKPERLVPHEWFREVPALTGKSLKSSPQEMMPDGRLVALRDYPHLALLGRPPTSKDLPANWHAPLSEWDWSETVKVEVKWPDYWMDLPEIF